MLKNAPVRPVFRFSSALKRYGRRKNDKNLPRARHGGGGRDVKL